MYFYYLKPSKQAFCHLLLSFCCSFIHKFCLSRRFTTEQDAQFLACLNSVWQAVKQCNMLGARTVKVPSGPCSFSLFSLWKIYECLQILYKENDKKTKDKDKQNPKRSFSMINEEMLMNDPEVRLSSTVSVKNWLAPWLLVWIRVIEVQQFVVAFKAGKLSPAGWFPLEERGSMSSQRGEIHPIKEFACYCEHSNKLVLFNPDVASMTKPKQSSKQR